MRKLRERTMEDSRGSTLSSQLRLTDHAACEETSPEPGKSYLKRQTNKQQQQKTKGRWLELTELQE